MASMSSTATTLSTISTTSARVSQRTQTLAFTPCSISNTGFFSRASSSSSPSSKQPISISFACSKHSPLLPPIIKRASSFRVNSSVNGKEQKPQVGTGGGGGDSGGSGGDGRKGLGGGGSGDHSEGDEEINKKQMAMSMSQKLTLGYAALVGVGGVMGYLKSGSQKSLAAGGLSSLLLYFVYTQLPTRPALASFLGMGLSAALLFVMGSRYKKSGKVFPAGVVSLVSLVMTGGYLHGIMRTMH